MVGKSALTGIILGLASLEVLSLVVIANLGWDTCAAQWTGPPLGPHLNGVRVMTRPGLKLGTEGSRSYLLLERKQNWKGMESPLLSFPVPAA